MRELLRAWWSWHIDAVYFLNDASYALYQDIFEPWDAASANGRPLETECWAAAAHDELLYCPDCGWTNPKTVTHGLGMAER